jgi:TolB protein
MRRIGVGVVVLGAVAVFGSGCSSIGGGFFDGSRDVGRVTLKGSTSYADGRRQYRVTGCGGDIGGLQDAFHYACRQLSGDVKLSASVAFESVEGNQHRKAGCMIRQSLDPNAAYVDAIVLGNGSIVLQYRTESGGQTREIQSTIKNPLAICLERDGDVFTFSASKAAGVFQPIGSIVMTLHDPVCAGLAVCSHDADRLETAVFSNTTVEALGAVPADRRVLESTLEVLDIATGERHIVRRAREHFESPNWSPDGRTLVYNSRGRLYSLAVSGGEPKPVESGSASQCTGEHGFSPDGKRLAVSSGATGAGPLVYVIPGEGGEAKAVTQRGPSYWHGWSPDGQTLVFSAERDGKFDVYTVPAVGGLETRLTTADAVDDGPEYSPDGQYIYFSSARSGRMKIWRMRPDGSGQEQMTSASDTADWFPHLSPDGKWLAFIAYDKSVEGHPANRPVTLRLVSASGGQPKVVATLCGGDGTMNAPSWSPDSRKIAFVSYRMVAKDGL